MATKLKNMRLTSVDLVRNGANQEADICLFKSAEGAEQPTERETNILKRFLNWLRENPEADENEPQNPVEKADTQAGIVDIYKSAITESLQSIAADETLTATEKNDMIAKSLGEYHDAMVELLVFGDEEGDIEKAYEDVEKFNPYHGADGRFSSANGGAGGASGDKVSARNINDMKNDLFAESDYTKEEIEAMGTVELLRAWMALPPVTKSADFDEIEVV